MFYGILSKISETLRALKFTFGPKDSRPSVRACVRKCVTRLLENRSLLFSETLQLVRAFKREKNVPSAFLKKIPVFAHFGQKLSKIGHLAGCVQ